MEIISFAANQATFRFSKDEFRGVTNTLNEILHGFGWDFSGTNWTKPDGVVLSDSIEKNYKRTKDDGAICSFTKEEILFLIIAMGATIDELERSYSIRMGYTIAEARQLQADLQSAMQVLS